MRLSLALGVISGVIFGNPAFADVPPPPDMYVGQTSVNFSGLQFDRQQIRHTVPPGAPFSERHPGGYQTLIFLTDCTPTHTNCQLAKSKNVLGWAVLAVNGVRVYDDMGEFKNIIQLISTGQKINLSLELENDDVTEPKLDISFVSQ